MSMGEPSIISGGELKKQLAEALGLNPSRVHRIVLDVECDPEPIVAYVELHGDERLLELGWSDGHIVVEK
jgi:hypothetical protein